ncbi:hypothetical protein C8R46DRAFT_581829 [Mycena filopes]|nr:hypothetical protein C8R46DRAFT_581829 [Mycena filopes]
MGKSPSILERTPREHALATARYLEAQRGILIWPPETQVPASHVRVQFYAYRFHVRDGLRPDMEAALPLEKSGALSLFAVRRMWGLESCSIIDPPELKLGFSADPNWLPADVVKELVRKHHCIKLIEPYASYETLAKRQLRHIALAGASLLRSYSILAHSSARNDLHSISRLQLTDSAYLDWVRVGVLIALFFVVFCKPEFLVSLVDAITPSACLAFLLAAAFLAVPDAHARWGGLEDRKAMMVVVLVG